MSIDVFSSARLIARETGWCRGNLDIQRLLYLSSIFYMGDNDGEPLVNGYFEATDFGPVHPRLFKRLKIFGAEPVEEYIFYSSEPYPTDSASSIIKDVCRVLNDATSGRLMGLTHKKGGGWSRNYTGRCADIIPNRHMMEEYYLFSESKASADARHAIID